MGIKLQSAIKNNNERELKSIVYKDAKNNICVAYKDFKIIKENYSEFVEVYKPNKSQKEEIRRILAKHMSKAEKNNFSDVETNEELLFKLFKELTDLLTEDFNLENEEDLNIWNSLTNNPSDFVIVINDELNEIQNGMLVSLVKNVQELNRFPSDIRRDIVINMKEIQKQNKLKQEKIKLEKELAAEKEEYLKMKEKLKAFEEKFGVVNE